MTLCVLQCGHLAAWQAGLGLKRLYDEYLCRDKHSITGINADTYADKQAYVHDKANEGMLQEGKKYLSTLGWSDPSPASKYNHQSFSFDASTP